MIKSKTKTETKKVVQNWN